MRAFLVLEDGTVFEGKSIGAAKEAVCEIVFNTSMTGYLEVLTDPSYAGQAVVMTYPLIGNYGVCRADMESGRVWPEGYILRELSRMPSNFRSEEGLEEVLLRFGIPGIAGVDTRGLTRILREKGTMNGMITTRLPDGPEMGQVLERIRAYRVAGAVQRVTGRSTAEYAPGDLGTGVPQAEPSKRVAVYDFGTKKNILRCLLRRGCKVRVFPADARAEEVLSWKPDGIMLTNGPGDPAECAGIIAELQKLFRTEVPVFAICLGHQLMALAAGAKTEKMKYGHRGVNHPVKDLETGRVYITSQNHGYVVREDSLDPSVAKVRFFNVNDGTVEGLRYVGKKIFTVQFHPEACGGPKDSEFLFDEMMAMMQK